jgi:enamine deaminase RidA (YjgF/YER057c/UK114 family)
VLHVQSISEWAPSCIGPYSQATRHQGLVHFAGQVRVFCSTGHWAHGPARTAAVHCTA